MNKKIALLTLAFATLTAASLSYARPQDTDYMACSIVDNETYISIMAIPQAYNASMGPEEPIMRRSCDSKQVQGGYGWMTVHDCSKQLKQAQQILRQLQASRACPASME